MDPLYNPFATSDSLDLTGTNRRRRSQSDSRVNAIVSEYDRAARRDPIDEEVGRLTSLKTDLGRTRTALANTRESFIQSHGADLFEMDLDLDGRPKPMLDANKRPVLKWGPDGSATREMIDLRTRAKDDPAAAAALAEREAQFGDKRIRLAMERWQRLQEQEERLNQADRELEGQLGSLSAARLQRDGVLARPEAAAPAVAPAAQPAAQPAPTEQPAAASPAPGGKKLTPLEIIKMHRQVKDAEAVMAMETSNPSLVQGQARKAEALRQQIASGMAALPEGLQKRVIDHTRDPSFWEQTKNFVGRVGEGAGAALVDSGEFIARNAMRVVGAGDSRAAKWTEEFAQEMRNEAATWGRMGVPKEVLEKVDAGLAGDLGQGIGSALSFMAPGVLVGKAAKAAKLSEKAQKVLITSTVATMGASGSGNAGRRQAIEGLGALRDNGEITDEEYRRGVNQAEGIFALAGVSEIVPLTKMASRLSKVPGGDTFISELLERFGRGGSQEANRWLGGAGREALHRIRTAMGEGFEEAVQEFGQSVAENLTASGKFGNVAWDPDRAIISSDSSEQAGIGFIVGALLGAATAGRAPRPGQQPAAPGAPATPPPAPADASDPAETEDPAVDPDLESEFAGQPPPATGGASVGDTAAPVAQPGPATGGMWEIRYTENGQQKTAQVQANSVEEANTRARALGLKPDAVLPPKESPAAAASEETTRGGIVSGVTPPAAADQSTAAPGVNQSQDAEAPAPAQSANGQPPISTQGSQPSGAGSAPDLEAGESPSQPGTEAGSAPAPVSDAPPRMADTLGRGDFVTTDTGETFEVLNVSPLSKNNPEPLIEVRWDNGKETAYKASQLESVLAPQPYTDASTGERKMSQPARIRKASAAPVSPGEATPETLEGEPIDREWTSFAPESGTLGIPRAEMPQIKAEHRGAMVNFLKGRGITHREEERLPGNLKPTQAEYSQDKVDKAREFEGGDRAILVSSDDHVVDGHHQWMAKLNDAPDQPMRVIRLDAPIRELLSVVKEFPSAENSGGATSAQPSAVVAPTGEKPGEEAKENAGESPADRPSFPAAPRPPRLTEAVETASPVGDRFTAGQVVKTSSGRDTTPFPKIDTSTNLKAKLSSQRVDKWLLENAIAEAQARGDDFNLRSFRAEVASNLPPASKDAMEQYLFGEQPAVPRPALRPLSPPAQALKDNVTGAIERGEKEPIVEKPAAPSRPIKTIKGDNGMEVWIFPSTDPSKPGFNAVLVDTDANQNAGYRIGYPTVEAAEKGGREMLGPVSSPDEVQNQRPTENPQGQVGGPQPAPANVTTPAAGSAPAQQEGDEAKTVRAAEAIAPLLERTGPFDWRELFAAADTAFGGTQASGAYTPKDAYDALELAVNRFILNSLGSVQAETPEQATNVIQNLRSAILDRIPTQTKRTAEQDAMQQFSTPPTLAFAANWVANVAPSDVYLEPSAGIAGLAVFGKKAGARVVANELSPRRRGILSASGLVDVVTGENAENLHAIYSPKIKAGTLPRPTVVVMNPPFSNAAVSGKRGDTMIGAKHVEEALKLLAPGGRLVAIVGEGMAFGKPTFRAWWTRIQSSYAVRANVSVSGQEYRKYGTTFGNQLLVIDKVAPTATAPVQGSVEKVEDLVTLLADVQRERPTADRPAQPSAQQGGTGSSAPVQDRPRVDTSRPDADSGASSPTPAGGRPEAAEPVSTPQQQGEADAGSVQTGEGVDAGRGDAGNAGAGGRTTGDGAPVASEPAIEVASDATRKPTKRTDDDAVFSDYSPAKMKVRGVKAHPTPLVESAAMAAVAPPDPNYRPKIPKELLESGAISDAQLENVVYAGQSHNKELPGGRRAGYFIGDGTGVGKGRQIAAIILDNWNHGRRKAVWISKTGTLADDAKRDLRDLGMDPGLLVPIGKAAKAKTGTIGLKEGIIFSTYTSLAKDNEGLDQSGKLIRREGNKSRIEQIVDWLGEDFDGVIALDESHMAGNAIAVKGNRGIKKPSETGLAVVDLQALMPKARVVYVSATGATEVSNLSYAERLGIWGPGTPFSNKKVFIDQISAGGISAMEIVARDLKALGKYLARTLSFKGIKFERLEQSLTPKQKEIYDEVARGWQVVFENMDAAMASSGASNSPKARSAARSAFFGAQQRFFNQLLTAMEMPVVVSDIKKQLAANNSVVLQLVNTNEATQDREIARATTEEEADLEDLDLSPKDILLQYVSKSFPVAKFEEVADPNNPDKTRWVPVRDADGNPVEDPDAVARRDELLVKLKNLAIPENPLEIILNTFGHDAVAEVTGRSQRVVLKEKDGKIQRQIETGRTESTRKVEAEEFQDGKRRILVFSGAGGTGFSYHASRKAKNQQLRVHYLVQAGWRADAALQGFGRTHRSDQAQPPLYKLVTTDIQGHKRFVSTIARRLSQLGALTAGERKSTGQGLFSEKDNLESKYAEQALTRLFNDLYGNSVPGLDFGAITRKMGFGYTNDEGEWVSSLISENGALNQEKIPTVQQFLNRILALEVAEQNVVFDAFFERLELRIENAKEDGTYDPGTQAFKGDSIVKKADDVVYRHPESTAETRVVEVERAQKIKFTKFEDVKSTESSPVAGYVKNNRSGKIYALKEGGTRTMEDGSVVRGYRRIGPNTADFLPKAEMTSERYTVLKPDEARTAWEAEIAASDPMSRDKATFIVGSFLPIWDRIKLGSPRIYRVTTDDGEGFLGALIPEKLVSGVKQRLGAKVGAVTPSDAFRLILEDGASYELANGWKLKRARVSGDFRIEVLGAPYTFHSQFTSYIGGFIERIGYVPRLFIPVDPVSGVEALGKLLNQSPVVGDGDTVQVESATDGGEFGADNNLDPASPAAMTWADVPAGEQDPVDAQRLSDFEAGLNRARRKQGLSPVRLSIAGLADPSASEYPARGLAGRSDVRAGDAQESFRQTAKRLSQAFNKRIIFFRPSEQIGTVGMTAPTLANTILVNVEAKNPLHVIVGHELSHTMKAQRPDDWKAVRDAIRAIAPMPEAYPAFKIAHGYEADKVEDEWVGDVLGERFEEADFWKAFDRALKVQPKSEQAGRVKSLADWMVGWLDRLLGRIRKLFANTHRYAEDLQFLRERLAWVTANYATASESLPDNPQGQSDADAELATDGDEAVEIQRRELSRFPESLRDREQPVESIAYDVRAQAEAAAEARRVIEKMGEKRAEAAALDRSSDMKGDVRVGIFGELIGRRAAELKDADSVEARKIVAEMDRLVAAAQPSLATDAGQQISMFNHIYKDRRISATAEYVKGVQKRQEGALGEDAINAIDGAAEELNDAAREAVSRMERNLPQIVRKMLVSRSIWQKYRASVAEEMLKLVAMREGAPREKAPLQEFTRRVSDVVRTRLEAQLPPQQRNQPPAPMDVLKEAIENKEKYQDVFDTVRAAFAQEYEGRPEVMEMIDMALADIGVRPYTEKLRKKAIKAAFDAMKVKVAELARRHFTRTDATAADLARALVDEAGIKGEDAKQVSDDLETTARRLIGEARSKALDALQKRYTTPRARKVLDTIGRVVELNNLGAFSRQTLLPDIAKALKLRGVDPDRLKRIAQLADLVETAPNASEKARAELEILNEIRIGQGFSKVDLGTAIWFANMLSGYTTQLVNIAGNAMNGTLQLATTMAANPRQAAQALAGYIEGFGEGWTQAKAIVRTGRGTREFDARTGTSSPVLELVDYTRDFPDMNKAIAKGLNVHARALAYVFRFMKGVDAAFYYPAREAQARVIAAKLLAANYSGAELRKKVRETLGIAPDQWAAARKQAEAEGFTGPDLAIRMSRIIEETRSKTEIGRQAEEAGVKFGKETTYNNDPEGWAGVLYQHLAGLTESVRPGGVPVLKAFLPFLRIPTNIFNASMNYTPLGAARAFRGMATKYEGGEVKRREFTEEERNRLFVQSIAGSLAMGGLAAMALRGLDDEEEPFFTITATGPADWRARQQLEATGWRRHSIKFGDTWIPYKDSPLLTPLAVVGNVVDAIRYEKTKDDATLGSHTVDAVLRAPRVIFETSMLSGLGQLFDFLQDRSSAERLTQFLVRTPSGVVVPNLLSQIDRTFNPEVRAADGPLGSAGASLPFVRNTGSERSDVFGETVERSPLDRFVSLEANNPVREVLRDKNVFISVPQRSTKIGNRPMEPQEYDQYVRISGQRIYQRLSGAVPRLRSMDAEALERLVDRITREERERAKLIVARDSRLAGSRN